MGSGGGPWSAILPKMLRRRPTPSGGENPPTPGPAPGAPEAPPKPEMLILNPPPSGIPPIPPAGPPPIGPPDPNWSAIPAPMTLIRRRVLIAGLTTC